METFLPEITAVFNAQMPMCARLDTANTGRLGSLARYEGLVGYTRIRLGEGPLIWRGKSGRWILAVLMTTDSGLRWQLQLRVRGAERRLKLDAPAKNGVREINFRFCVLHGGLAHWYIRWAAGYANALALVKIFLLLATLPCPALLFLFGYYASMRSYLMSRSVLVQEGGRGMGFWKVNTYKGDMSAWWTGRLDDNLPPLQTRRTNSNYCGLYPLVFHSHPQTEAAEETNKFSLAALVSSLIFSLGPPPPT